MAEANKRVKVTCPRCGAEGEAPVWDVIDAQQSKRDARHVLNESIFDVDCSRCGYRVSLNYPLAYYDGEQKFCIYYVTSTDAVEKAESDMEGLARHMKARADRRAARASAVDAKADEAAIEEAGEAAARAALEDPCALDGYRLRIVTTRNALREKVAILRGGMDDHAIEVIKLATFNMAAAQRKLKGATDACYGGVSKDGKSVGVKFTGGRKYHETTVPMQTYESVLADVERYLGGEAGPLLVDREWAQRFTEQMRAR